MVSGDDLCVRLTTWLVYANMSKKKKKLNIPGHAQDSRHGWDSCINSLSSLLSDSLTVGF